MTKTPQSKELTREEADIQFDPAGLGFESTEDLEPLNEILGQPRAMKALDLGLGIRHPTYNVYVAGLSGTGKKQTIERVLNGRVADEEPPDDWAYVYNFDETDRPLAVNFEAGRASAFKAAMHDFVEHLRHELPKAFRQEDFSRQKQRIGRNYEQKHKESLDELDKQAREQGLTVQQTPDGQIGMAPLKDDRPMTREEFEQLSDDEKEEITNKQRDLMEQVQSVMTQGRQLQRDLQDDVRSVERNFATEFIDPQLDQIKTEYAHPKLEDWFGKLRAHMLDHLERFRDGEDNSQQQNMARMLGMPAGQQDQTLKEYSVNVVVDNGKREHAPVITEESPNYKNLFGTTGGAVDRFGRVTSDFTNVRAGSLLRANGGYLVMNLLDALMEPLVWKELKRSIKSGQMEFHAYDPLGVFTASAIRPQPIPLDVKLVVLGNPLVYHLLHLYDEDFGEIFKVKADFATEMDRDEETGRALGRLVRKLTDKKEVPPFAASGVAELARSAVRMAGHRDKITAEFSRLTDLVREAAYWAGNDKADRVEGEHVRRATEERVYRSNLIAAKIRELISEGTLLIDTDGTTAGQVNGLAVINLGDYMFGKPSRVTASTGIGTGGIVNIERESKLSGQTYDKAILILDGYLRTRYAQEHPIALSAGLTMEQSYGMIDGDSASIAELSALLSSISAIPLRQDIGVTGSVNQWGDVQAVGAVNEKVEGFFDVCREKELTGQQGVCIPAANVRHLVLRPDVLDAIEAGRFHVWPVDHIDRALELLSGVPAGAPDEADSFHGKVDAALRRMVDVLKEQKAVQDEHGSAVLPGAAPGQRDPRPPLPGRE